MSNETIEQTVTEGCVKFLLWLPVVAFIAFPLALIAWWMSSYIPFIPDGMGYWQWYALVVLVHALWGRG